MIDGEGAFDLDALPELLTRGGGRVEKVKPKNFRAAARVAAGCEKWVWK